MSNEVQDLSIATLALVILGMSGLVVYLLVSLVRLQRKHDALVRGHNKASDIEDAERERQPGRPRLRVVESWFGLAALFGLARWIKHHAGHSITVTLIGVVVVVPGVALLPHLMDPPDRDDDRVVVTATAAAPPTRRNGALLGPAAPRAVSDLPPLETTSSAPPAPTTTPTPTATATPTTAAPTTVTPTTVRPTSTPSSSATPTAISVPPTTTAAPITTAPGSGQPRAGGPDPGGSPATSPTSTPPTAPTTALLVVGGPTPAPIVPRETCLHVIVLDACVGVR